MDKVYELFCLELIVKDLQKSFTRDQNSFINCNNIKTITMQ